MRPVKEALADWASVANAIASKTTVVHKRNAKRRRMILVLSKLESGWAKAPSVRQLLNYDSGTELRDRCGSIERAHARKRSVSQRFYVSHAVNEVLLATAGTSKYQQHRNSLYRVLVENIENGFQFQ
jgi:hypothetical protein